MSAITFAMSMTTIAISALETQMSVITFAISMTAIAILPLKTDVSALETGVPVIKGKILHKDFHKD